MRAIAAYSLPILSTTIVVRGSPGLLRVRLGTSSDHVLLACYAHACGEVGKGEGTGTIYDVTTSGLSVVSGE